MRKHHGFLFPVTLTLTLPLACYQGVPPGSGTFVPNTLGGSPTGTGSGTDAVKAEVPGFPQGISSTGTNAGNLVEPSGPTVTPPEPVVDPADPLPAKAVCEASVYSDKYIRPYVDPPDPQVATLMQTMTREQKFRQMQGYYDISVMGNQAFNDIQRSHDDEELGIRGYRYRDGPRGLNVSADYDGVDPDPGFATAFPVTMSRSATWDPEIEFQVGRAQGDETAAVKAGMLLGPCMNILRHPAWGRSQETYGEDNYQVGRMATAYTVGLQEFVAGCAKHYTANNIENRRANLNADMDEQTLRETYGRHFEMVVQDGGVACMMAAYNAVNRIKATQNHHVLTEILRDDMGFRGLVISDWWAMPPGQAWVKANVGQQNAAQAVHAGMDLEVPWINNYAYLGPAVDSGNLKMEDVDNSTRRILEQKFRFNTALMDGEVGLATPITRWEDNQIKGNEPHVELARSAGARGMVLLKNDDATLPITAATPTVAVVGPHRRWGVKNHAPSSGTIRFAEDIALGDRGSSRVNANPAQTTGPLAGFRAVAAEKGLNITFNAGSSADEVGNADLIVAIVGHTPSDESEEYQVDHGGDRLDYNLQGDQNAFIDSLTALNKPIVVVLETGGSVALPWLENPNIKSVVQAWFPGQAGGLSIADQLLGANTWGRLPFTWANSYSDWPVFNEANTTVMGYFVGYRRFEAEGISPLYPFGYGLTYTSFTYSNLSVPCSEVAKNGTIMVTVDIQNTGSVAGEAVPQLYVSWPGADVNDPAQKRRAIKQLKSFYRTPTIEPGQTMRVPLPVRVKDLKYFDMPSNSWRIESGELMIHVGPNAGDLPLTDTVMVQ